MNVQSKNLNVEREKLNDESANSDVKQQMYDKMRKVECKMKHSILAGMERHKKCQSQSKVFDLPNEYISKNTSGAECQRALVSITSRLLSATYEIQKDRNRGIIDQFININILTWLRGLGK